MFLSLIIQNENSFVPLSKIVDGNFSKLCNVSLIVVIEYNVICKLVFASGPQVLKPSAGTILLYHVIAAFNSFTLLCWVDCHSRVHIMLPREP